MTTNTKIVKKVTSTLKLPRPVTDLLALATHIVTSMTNNPHFPTPDPPLTTLTATQRLCRPRREP